MSVSFSPRAGSRRALFVGTSLIAAACTWLACSTENSEFIDTADASGGASSGATASGGVSSGGGGLDGDDGSSSGGASSGASGGCGPNFTGIVRDFKAWKNGQGHPDFERYGGAGQKQMVLPDLGADHKPVYNPDVPEGHLFITSAESFSQWYRDVPGVNIAIPYTIPFEDQGDGRLLFDSSSFFPIDGQGFGDEGLKDHNEELHNFGFTFELHTEFKYRGGETFLFSGDDDLWVFINRKLAIDLGGLHPRQEQEVKLDEIAESHGLTPGQTYELSVFHAERRTTRSQFRIETSIEFTNCEQIVH